MDSHDTSGLCYLTAGRLEGPLPTLDHLDVRTLDDEPLGQLDGIIIDRPAQRMRYFVVDAGDRAHHRYLVPLCPSLLDPDQHTLRVDVAEPLTSHEAFDPDAFASLSDEDLRKVVFDQPRREDDDEPRTRRVDLRSLELFNRDE